MAMMFGRFEIQSEISKSETASIYKALDTETSQIVALKTQSLAPLGDRAAPFVDALIAEGERALPLTCQNIVPLYGAGEIDGQFCAAMEYVQGNSLATMLERKEGFSIWDLLDITRQVCAALEHAAARGVVHYSLEPDKILVQWDGLVKVLGYGISNMSLIEAEAGNGLGRLMPYCSPEQICGEPTDQRSNQFSLGTILYEMVVGRKAFDAEDPVVLVGQIENEMPEDPVKLNAKMQPAVSDLIMRALAKDPDERYQTVRELLVDLEGCKDTGKKTALDTSARRIASKVQFDTATRKAVAKKFVSAPSGDDPAPAPRSKAAAAAAMHAAASMYISTSDSSHVGNSGTRLIEPKDIPQTDAPQDIERTGAIVLPAASIERTKKKPAAMMAAPATADPMMASAASAAPVKTGSSFSELDEMPPLKRPAPSTAATEPISPPAAEQNKQADAKKMDCPRLQPREVAGKAMRQIATVPPRLMMFSILGAVAVILVVAVAIFLHVHSEDDGSVAAPRPVKTESTPAPAPRVQGAPSPKKQTAPVVGSEPAVTVRHFDRHRPRSQESLAPAPQAAMVPGDALIDSAPQGAQFQVDGKSDPSWITPFSLAGLSPGKHVVAASKSGYSNEIRSVDVVSGGKSSLVFHLAPMNALVVVTSAPAGAEITIDGRSTGKVTPAQFAVGKGYHTIVVKKQGFLDETTTADLGPGQNFQYAPVLKALGNTEAIHTVGKFKKIFGGGGGESTAGMGSLSIHTQPRGAQVVINQRILDKMSPVDLMMGPGTYVVDITLTGFKPVHKIVSVEKGGKIAIDEVLERQ